MKQITQTLSMALIGNERDIVKDSYKCSRPVRDMKDSELKGTITNIITKAFADTGTVIKPLDDAPGDITISQSKALSNMAVSLIREIREYFAYATISEIDNAINKGIRGEYGEYYGLNLVTFHKFIKSYLGSFERQEALRKQKLHEQESTMLQTKQLPPVNENSFMDQACIEAFESYRKNPKKEIIDFGNVKYHHLDKKGLIDFDIEEKTAIFNQAKAIAYQRGDMLPAKNVHDIISQMKGAENINPEEIKIEARNLALKYYFDYLISSGMELKDLINKK